jgi:YD repeat-containing protein
VGAGSSSTYTYPTGGLYATGISTPGGRTTNIVYDSAGRIQTVSPPYVNDSSTQEGYSVGYDSYGQVTSRTIVTDLANSETVQTTYAYDSNGNLETIKPNNDTNLATTLDYDALGNVTMVTDADARETEFFYGYSGCGSCGGSLGQLVKAIDPLNKETHYEYDANGNMTKVTLDAGVGGLQRSTSYEYDLNNRLVKIVSPTGSANEMTFTYDKIGRLTQRTSFEGVTTSYTYDHMGRVTEVYDSVGTFIAYTYDSMGKVLTVEDDEGHITALYRIPLEGRFGPNSCAWSLCPSL